MWLFVVKRAAASIPVVIGISLLAFALLQAVPGDPVTAILGDRYTPEAAASLRRDLNLDSSIVVQYFSWLMQIARGNLGTSLFSGDPVWSLLKPAVMISLLLAVGGTLLACAIGMPLGLYSSLHPGGWVDRFSRVFALGGVSIPVYWIGLVLILIFSVRLAVLPAGGSPFDFGWKALLLPSVSVGISFAGILARTTRGAMLEIVNQPYVETAWANGLPPRTVLWTHIFPNALIPIVTVIGLQFGLLVGGAVLTEIVFALPGVGNLLVQSVFRRDYPVLQGCLLVITVAFVLVNLVTDILYGLLDPRIRQKR
ncbi:ABC transporter permease [Aquamicrobium soli]|uniref:ABC transporter permease n=1 Tax=Aquamicrobium soli TaxID=1811518 RepID=A0ABV7KDM7_9HYPH